MTMAEFKASLSGVAPAPPAGPLAHGQRVLVCLNFGEQEARVSAADDLSGAIVLLSTRLDRSGPSTDLALRPQEGLIVLIPS